MNEKSIYLSYETNEQYNKLNNASFEKKDELKIHVAEKGIVIPYDTSIVPAAGGVINGTILDDFSLSAHNNPFKNNFYIRAGNIPNHIENIENVNEEVIYLGDACSFWGHFLTDSLSRLWILLNSEYRNFKVCYIGSNPSNPYIEAYYLFGIKKEQILFINKPTRFSKVIIPEPSYRFWDYWHNEYKKTFDKIREGVKKEYHYTKIYLSRSSYFGGSGTFGEEPIEKVFKRQGYKIIHPENYSFSEKIAIFKNCKFLAGLSGSTMHNVLFCNDKITCYVLNRSPCIMPMQLQIDRMKNLNTYYIDAYINVLPTLDFAYPYLVGLSKKLELFFDNNKFHFSKKTFYKSLPVSLYNFLYFWKKQVITKGFTDSIIHEYSSDINVIDIANNIDFALSNYLPITKKTKYHVEIKDVLLFLPRKIIPKKIKNRLKLFIKAFRGI